MSDGTKRSERRGDTVRRERANAPAEAAAGRKNTKLTPGADRKWERKRAGSATAVTARSARTNAAAAKSAHIGESPAMAKNTGPEAPVQNRAMELATVGQFHPELNTPLTLPLYPSLPLPLPRFCTSPRTSPSKRN